jgi:TonB family protein
VALLNTSLVRFFLVSVAVHTLLFSFIYLGRHVKFTPQQPIAVSVLLAPEKDQAAAPTPIPRAPTRPSKVKAPTVVAKKDSPVTKERSVPAREKTVKNDIGRQDSVPAAPSSAPPSEPIREKTVVAERELPTVKDLLPPLTWSSSNSRVSAPVSLNTRDPIFVSYFNKIKQSIESEWEYPELALRYGLQGKLSLEFTIANDGQLAQLRLVRSSGSQLLDEEAIRAIKAAAPFPPIPPWIKPNPLPIAASMEYHDNRLNYGFSR